MNRLTASLVATLAVAGVVAALGRAPAAKPPAASSPAVRTAERLGAAGRAPCTSQAPESVQTSNVNLIVNDALTSTGEEAGCATPQDEPAVAVNPRDPRN